MINGRHPEIPLAHPLSMLPGNPVLRVNEPLGGDPTQADNDLGSDQSHLIAQKADAGVLLRFQRIPVAGRTALDNVADIAIFLSVQVNNGQHIIQ